MEVAADAVGIFESNFGLSLGHGDGVSGHRDSLGGFGEPSGELSVNVLCFGAVVGGIAWGRLSDCHSFWIEVIGPDVEGIYVFLILGLFDVGSVRGFAVFHKGDFLTVQVRVVLGQGFSLLRGAISSAWDLTVSVIGSPRREVHGP